MVDHTGLIWSVSKLHVYCASSASVVEFAWNLINISPTFDCTWLRSLTSVGLICCNLSMNEGYTSGTCSESHE